MQIVLLILAGLVLFCSGGLAIIALHTHFWQEDWTPFAFASLCGFALAITLGYYAFAL